MAFGNSGGNLIQRADFAGWGDVPELYQDRHYRDRIMVWIYSYGTPIAWRHGDGTWYMPPVRYSQTTSGHQGRVADAIGYDFKSEVSLMVGHGHGGRYGGRKGW